MLIFILYDIRSTHYNEWNGFGLSSTIMFFALHGMHRLIGNTVVSTVWIIVWLLCRLRGIDEVRNKIKVCSQKKVTLPPGRHKIVLLDEADRCCLALFKCRSRQHFIRLS